MTNVQPPIMNHGMTTTTHGLLTSLGLLVSWKFKEKSPFKHPPPPPQIMSPVNQILPMANVQPPMTNYGMKLPHMDCIGYWVNWEVGNVREKVHITPPPPSLPFPIHQDCLQQWKKCDTHCFNNASFKNDAFYLWCHSYTIACCHHRPHTSISFSKHQHPDL